MISVVGTRTRTPSLRRDGRRSATARWLPQGGLESARHQVRDVSFCTRTAPVQLPNNGLRPTAGWPLWTSVSPTFSGRCWEFPVDCFGSCPLRSVAWIRSGFGVGHHHSRCLSALNITGRRSITPVGMIVPFEGKRRPPYCAKARSNRLGNYSAPFVTPALKRRWFRACGRYGDYQGELGLTLAAAWSVGGNSVADLSSRPASSMRR